MLKENIRKKTRSARTRPSMPSSDRKSFRNALAGLQQFPISLIKYYTAYTCNRVPGARVLRGQVAPAWPALSGSQELEPRPRVGWRRQISGPGRLLEWYVGPFVDQC